MGPGAAAGLALALLLAALPLPPAASEPALCSAFATAVPPAHAVLQDDAGSGTDAGDALAAAMPLGFEGYVLGYLDPAVGHDAADTEDWYGVELPGAGEVVSVGMTWDYASVVPGYQVLAQVYAPGGQLVFTTGSAEEPRNFTNHVAGWWHIRVFHTPLADAPPLQGPCASVPASPGLEVPARNAQNYGMYFGCHPHCLALRGA